MYSADYYSYWYCVIDKQHAQTLPLSVKDVVCEIMDTFFTVVLYLRCHDRVYRLHALSIIHNIGDRMKDVSTLRPLRYNCYSH